MHGNKPIIFELKERENNHFEKKKAAYFSHETVPRKRFQRCSYRVQS